MMQTHQGNGRPRGLTFASPDGHALGWLRTWLYKLFASVVDIYLSELLSVVCGWGQRGPLRGCQEPSLFGSVRVTQSHCCHSHRLGPLTLGAAVATWHVPAASSVGRVMSAMLSETMKIKGWRGGYVWKEMGGAHGCLSRGGGVCGVCCVVLAILSRCFPSKITGGHFR